MGFGLMLRQYRLKENITSRDSSDARDFAFKTKAARQKGQIFTWDLGLCYLQFCNMVAERKVSLIVLIAGIGDWGLSSGTDSNQLSSVSLSYSAKKSGKDARPREADISSVSCWWGTGQETDNYSKKAVLLFKPGVKECLRASSRAVVWRKISKTQETQMWRAGLSPGQSSQTKGTLQQLLLRAKPCNCAGDVVVANRLVAIGIPSSSCSLLLSFWDSGPAQHPCVQPRAADSPESCGKAKQVASAPV